MPASVRRPLGAREGALWKRQARHYNRLEKTCTAAVGRCTSTSRGQVGISPWGFAHSGQIPTSNGIYDCAYAQVQSACFVSIRSGLPLTPPAPLKIVYCATRSSLTNASLEYDANALCINKYSICISIK